MEQQMNKEIQAGALLDHLQAHFTHRGDLVLSESEQYGVYLVLDRLRELLDDVPAVSE